MKRFLVLLFVWLATAASAQAQSSWPSECIQPIAIGQTIDGTLSQSSCGVYYNNDPENLYYTNVYVFDGTAGQQIAIQMSSTEVDTWLELYDVNDVQATPLDVDDDGGDGTNSRIPADSGYFTLPTTGTYYIWANTAYPNQIGAYTISVIAASGGGGGKLPPPTGSPFQQTVMTYVNTILGFASGDIASLDQMKSILTAGLDAVLYGGTCPVATIDPPLTEDLLALPSTLTITLDFGSGCAVPSDSGPTTVAGTGMVTFTNLVLAETILGDAAITLNNLSVNGVPVAHGNATGNFNITLGASGDTITFSGPIFVNIGSLVLSGGLGASGTLNIYLDTAGTDIISANLISIPEGIPIILNGTLAHQPDGSIVIDTTAPSSVGLFDVAISNLKMDSTICETTPIDGTITFAAAGVSAAVTFDSTCSYSYSGP